MAENGSVSGHYGGENYASPSPSTGSGNSIRHMSGTSKKNNPCQNESDAIIEFLNKCYEKNSQNQNGKSKDPSEQSQFKNLRKELLSFVRRLKRSKKNGNYGLLDALTKEDGSKCLIIRRNLDGRIQVDGRKVWPHAFMFHIYVSFIKGDTNRTLSSGNHSELRSKANLEVPCQFPFSNDKTEDQTHLCINPLHYEEKLKIEVNHYIPKASLAEPPKALAWAKSSPSPSPHDSQSNGSKNENMLPPNSSNIPKQKNQTDNKKRNKDKTAIHIEDGQTILHNISQSTKLWSRPETRASRYGEGAYTEKAKDIINFQETVARAAEKRSLHNTRSRSPNQNRKLQQEMILKSQREDHARMLQMQQQQQQRNQQLQQQQQHHQHQNSFHSNDQEDFASQEVQNIKDQLQGIDLTESSIVQHTAFNPTDCLQSSLTGPGDPYSDFGPSSNSDISNFRSSNHSGDHQFNQSAYGMNDDSMVHQLIPTPHNTIDENDEYFTVSGPIFLTEDPEKAWIRITYYECNNKRMNYDSNRDNVDLFFDEMNRPQHIKSRMSNLQQFDLAAVKNINRSQDTWDLLDKLGKGISVTYDRNTRLVTCANNSQHKAYILSYTQNIKSTMHEESLIVIKPGSQRVVYDGRFVATLINDLNAQTGTYDDAEKWALAGQYSTYFTVFRIAFQAWGPDYQKKTLVDCDMWIEFQMLDFLDLFNRMQDHYELITNS